MKDTKKTIRLFNRLALAICVLLIAGLICGIVGVVMLFYSDDRIDKIEYYNYYVKEWNNEVFHDFDYFWPRVQVDSTVVPCKKSDAISGEYYPLRDSCTKKGDPALQNGKVLFYHSHINIPQSDFNLSVTTIYNISSILFSKIHPIILLELHKRDIYCESGISATCEKECDKLGGTWSSDYVTCTIIAYLNSICLRVSKSKKTKQWTLDPNPPHSPHRGDKYDSYGCHHHLTDNLYSYIDHRHWLSLSYSLIPSSTLSIDVNFFMMSYLQIRNSLDPYIIASALTEGCSSNTEIDTDCVGKSHHEIKQTALILLGVCLIVLVISIILVIVLRKQFQSTKLLHHILTALGIALFYNHPLTQLPPSTRHLLTTPQPQLQPLTVSISDDVSVHIREEREEAYAYVSTSIADVYFSPMNESFVGTREGI